MSIVVAPLTGPSGSSSAVKATSTPPTSNSAYASDSNSANDTLTQADFLQIMVAQFTNQDPLSDSDGSGGSGTSDYVEELMSMTNLTTMQTMSNQQSMSLAGSLPGSTVVLNNNGAAVTGVVTNATIENATLFVTVGGKQYPASDLVQITQSQAQALAAANASNASGTGTSNSGTNSSTPPSSS